jgi:hypothetical protein
MEYKILITMSCKSWYSEHFFLSSLSNRYSLMNCEISGYLFSIASSMCPEHYFLTAYLFPDVIFFVFLNFSSKLLEIGSLFTDVYPAP